MNAEDLDLAYRVNEDVADLARISRVSFDRAASVLIAAHLLYEDRVLAWAPHMASIRTMAKGY